MGHVGGASGLEDQEGRSCAPDLTPDPNAQGSLAPAGTPTVVVGAEARRPLMGGLGAQRRLPRRRLGQDVGGVAGGQLTQVDGQVTVGGGGADAEGAPPPVLAGPESGSGTGEAGPAPCWRVRVLPGSHAPIALSLPSPEEFHSVGVVGGGRRLPPQQRLEVGGLPADVVGSRIGRYTHTHTHYSLWCV